MVTDDLLCIEELVADLVFDPAERRAVLDAVRAFADNELDECQKAVLLEHADELVDTGNKCVIAMLATIGYEPAVGLVMLGGG